MVQTLGTVVVLLGVSALASAAPAHSPDGARPSPQAQTTVKDQPTPAELAWLQQLASDQPDVRDQAVTELMADDTLSDEALRRLYATAQEPQQRASLRRVALHLTLQRLAGKASGRNDRGILGMAPVGQRARQEAPVRPAGVIVRWAYPGSPAYVYLRPGDLITSVNGQAVPDSGTDQQITLEFINMVGRHKAGTTLSLHLYRDDRQLDVKLTLGSSPGLQSIYQGDGAGLRRVLTPESHAQVQKVFASLEALAPSPPVMTLTLPPLKLKEATADDEANPPDAQILNLPQGRLIQTPNGQVFIPN